MTPKPLVSVVVPTRHRDQYLRRAYECFRRQTHQEKEFIVLDDSEQPSTWIERVDDTRVKYRHITQECHLGAKRNELNTMAHGDVIVQFDDDDVYADSYIDTMLMSMGSADFVKLSAWFLLEESTGDWFYWDPGDGPAMSYCLEKRRPARSLVQDPGGEHANWRGDNLWGYGFSYVYRRALADAVSFCDHLDRGEDIAFATAARSRGARMVLAPDVSGLAVHVSHDDNTSRSFPNYRLPGFVPGRFFDSSLLANLRLTDRVQA